MSGALEVEERPGSPGEGFLRDGLETVLQRRRLEGGEREIGERSPPANLLDARIFGGHVLGVSRGHAAVLASRRAAGASRRTLLLAQIPLALFILALTLVTLWSLGQVVVAAAE